MSQPLRTRSSKKNDLKNMVSPNVIQKRKQWNEYLTDNKFKISKEAVLKRKNLLISKNNLLLQMKKSEDVGRLTTQENTPEFVSTLDLLISNEKEEAEVEKSENISNNIAPIKAPKKLLKEIEVERKCLIDKNGNDNNSTTNTSKQYNNKRTASIRAIRLI
jgi:hypothetical protein